MLHRDEPRTGLDDRHRHAEPGEHLGDLAAGRPAAEDEQAARQLAGERRLLVRPRLDVGQALDRRQLRRGADRDDDVGGLELVGRAVVGHRDPPATDDPGHAPVDDRAVVLERLHVRGVVGLGGARGPVDHVVASLGGAGPRVVAALRVDVGAMEQRLRGHAADVRARPAEPPLVDDGDGRAERACLVDGGLAGRAGTDDDEVELHRRMVPGSSRAASRALAACLVQQDRGGDRHVEAVGDAVHRQRDRRDARRPSRRP